MQRVEQGRRGCLKLGAVQVRELLQQDLAGGSDLEEHSAPIARIWLAAHQAARGGAVNELNGAVVADVEPCRQIANGGRVRGLRQAGDSEQELVLLGLETGPARGGLAEVQESSQLEAKTRECAELSPREGRGVEGHTRLYRGTMYFQERAGR